MVGPHADIVSTQRKGIATYISKTGYANGMVWDGRFVCGVGLSCVWCLTCLFMVGVCRGGCPGVPVSCVRVWDSPRVSGMPCRDHPGVFACVSGVCGKGGGTCGVPSLSRFGCGGVLLSHTLPGAVPSPCQVLASGFGMGPGVSPGPWPPQILCYASLGIVSPRVPLGDCGGLGTG